MADVVLLKLRLKPGRPQQFIRWIANVQTWLAEHQTVYQLLYNDASESLLAEEGMYTESMFLDRQADGDILFWYMEAESTDRVYEVFYESSAPITWLTEKALGWMLENPEEALDPQAAGGNLELLMHAVGSDRPGAVLASNR